MKYFGVVLLLAFLAPLWAGHLPDRNRNQKRPAPWQINKGGFIPTEFGDIVAVTGDSTSWGLVFQNSAGEIHLVRISSGNQVPQKATILERKYQFKQKSGK